MSVRPRRWVNVYTGVYASVCGKTQADDSRDSFEITPQIKKEQSENRQPVYPFTAQLLNYRTSLSPLPHLPRARSVMFGMVREKGATKKWPKGIAGPC